MYVKTSDATEISRHLEAAGMEIVAPFGPFKGWAELIVYSGLQTDPKTKRRSGGERGIIGYNKNQWWFQSWERIPGPGPETLEYYVSTVEEIIATTLRFFQGKPEKIRGWLVPTHRHPEWDVLHLHQTIAQARSLSQSEWDKVSQGFNEQYLQLAREFGRSSRIDRTGPWSWEKWFTCMVVLLEHEDPASKTLWVRRDLKEAFLVKEACPSCQCASLVRMSGPAHLQRSPADFSTYVCHTCDQCSRRSADGTLSWLLAT